MRMFFERLGFMKNYFCPTHALPCSSHFGLTRKDKAGQQSRESGPVLRRRQAYKQARALRSGTSGVWCAGLEAGEEASGAEAWTPLPSSL